MGFFEDMGIEFNEEETGEYVPKTINGMEVPSYRDCYHLNDVDDFADDEIIFGNPLLSDVESRTFDDDGEEVTKYSVTLYIVDDDEEWYQMPINLKEDGDIQHNVYPGSKLYPLIRGVHDLMYPDEASMLDKDVALKTCNLGAIRKMVNEEIERAGLKVKLVDAGDFEYNSFVLVSPKLEEQ